MNMPNRIRSSIVRVLPPLFSVFLAVGAPRAWSAPPGKPVSEGLEKVGDFFFRMARRLEGAGFAGDDDGDVQIIYDGRHLGVRRVPVDPREQPPSTGLTVPPGYRGYIRPAPQGRPSPYSEPVVPPGYRPYGEPFTPPNFQPHPQPGWTIQARSGRMIDQD